MVMKKLRLRLARWILGKHCACYQMGYNKLCDFDQIVQTRLDKKKKAKE
jgi:hypothetical protein